jgi:pimeloyl-ACP methyl ester carboxylesterase
MLVLLKVNTDEKPPMVPRGEMVRWQPTEVEFIRKSLDDLISKYNIDRTRIVAQGSQAGGAMAWLTALNHRDLIRAVARLDTALPARAQVAANGRSNAWPSTSSCGTISNRCCPRSMAGTEVVVRRAIEHAVQAGQLESGAWMGLFRRRQLLQPVSKGSVMARIRRSMDTHQQGARGLVREQVRGAGVQIAEQRAGIVRRDSCSRTIPAIAVSAR